MTEEMKAAYLIKLHGKEAASFIALYVIEELYDLPRIPYNFRREKFWRDVRNIIEKSE